MIPALSAGNISDMKKSGGVAAQALKAIGDFITVGLSTKDIELFFISFLNDFSAMRPAFKGYNGFPSSICVSVNDEVIHGVPSERKIINNGDLVSVDIGIEYNGVYVDTAYTYMIGDVSANARKLCDVTNLALYQGIKKVNIGATIGDIGFEVQQIVEKNGFSVVRQFVGHGIGHQLHMPPEVANFGKQGDGCKLTSNIALAIEPMVNAGRYQVDILHDGWTVRTKDRSLSAHYEHTVVVTSDGPLIITE
jgi:methionyl aminopeptidase